MLYKKKAIFTANVVRKSTRTKNLQGYLNISPGPMGWAYTRDYQRYPKLPCLRVSRVFSTLTPNVIRYKRGKILAYPTTFYL